MSFVRVGDLSEQIRGVTYGKEDASKTPTSGYLPVLRAGNITDQGLLYDDLVYVPAGRISTKQKLRAGDIVVAASSGSLDVVGKTAPVLRDFDGGFGAFCKVLRPNSRVEPKYFAQFFKTPKYRKTISALAAGANINNLRNEHLDELLVPLPPLPEQRRIAAILDQADALRAKRREALAQLDSLTQSIFIEMFGDPVSNDRAWPWAAISDFVAGFESGKSIVADDEDESDSPYRVLKISAVTSLEYKPELNKAMPSDYMPPASHIVRKGDLLFSRANTTELIGATAYVDETPDNLLLPDKLWRFVWFEKPRAAPRYVRHLFQQAKFRREIGDRASGSSGSMKNISQPKVLSIQVGNPPLSLQQLFSTRVQAIDILKATHRAALQELDRLFASLQHRAFSGEL